MAAGSAAFSDIMLNGPRLSRELVSLLGYPESPQDLSFRHFHNLCAEAADASPTESSEWPL